MRIIVNSRPSANQKKSEDEQNKKGEKQYIIAQLLDTRYKRMPLYL